MTLLILKKDGMALAALVILGSFGFAPEAQARGGDYCREYTEKIRIGGQWENGYGTVCLQEDGSWKIVVGTMPERHGEKRNLAYRDRFYEPMRTTVFEHRHPRLVYVYEVSRPYYRSPGHVKHHYKSHHKHHYKHHKKQYKKYHKHSDRYDDRGHGKERGGKSHH